MNTNAIIVDDEPNLVDYLAGKLAKLWPELTIAGTAHNGQDAIVLANEVQPDIAFLDIQMPNVSGLQVAEALPAKTKVVFITAYDEFAVDAFPTRCPRLSVKAGERYPTQTDYRSP